MAGFRVKHIKVNKRGALSVLLIMIFVSMSFASIAVFNASADVLKFSIYDGAMNIACRSILSEYDKKLKEDYGIYAYDGSKGNLEKKCIRYLRANTTNGFMPLTAKEIELQFHNADMSIGLVDNFLPQILEASVLNTAIRRHGVTMKDAFSADKKVLNKAIIKGLPSKSKVNEIISFDNLSIEDILRDKITNNALLNQYINTTFKSRYIDFPNRASFFNYEREYILSGMLSEKNSLDYVKGQLILLRLPLNTAHILSSPEKMNKIYKYIAMLPASAEPIEAAVIVALWAAAETDNDIRLLMEGKNVAFMKNEGQWALSLLDALQNLFTKAGKEPMDKKGYDYDEYLLALLYMKNNETKILRIMDLIQINMKSTYRGDFLIKDHFVGFNLNAQIDGREYKYIHRY